VAVAKIVVDVVTADGIMSIVRGNLCPTTVGREDIFFRIRSRQVAVQRAKYLIELVLEKVQGTTIQPHIFREYFAGLDSGKVVPRVRELG